MEKTCWILVADRAKARLLHALPDGQGPFPVLKCYVHEEGRRRDKDRDSAEPGRVIHPAGYVSAVEPHEDRNHLEARKFASILIDDLERNSLENRFDQLMVIAPPKFLGVLREAWYPDLKKKIFLEVSQDLMPLSDAELQQRLEGLMEATVA